MEAQGHKREERSPHHRAERRLRHVVRVHRYTRRRCDVQSRCEVDSREEPFRLREKLQSLEGMVLGSGVALRAVCRGERSHLQFLFKLAGTLTASLDICLGNFA